MARQPNIPWLDQRDGIYYAFWYDANKRRTERVSLRTRDADKARARFAAFLTTDASEYGGASAANSDCGAILRAYLDDRRGKVAAVQQREIYVGHLLKFFDGMPVPMIDIPAIERYVAARRAGRIGRPASEGSVRNDVATLKAAWHFAVRWRMLARGDVPEIELPARAERRLRWLSKGELWALLEAAEGVEYDVISALYYTASRKGALETLTVFQVDLQNWRLDLNPPGRRRTKKRKPIIPVADEIRPLIGQRHAAACDREDKLLFPEDIYRKVAAAAQRAGLHDVTPHTLRHTRASHLLMDGVQPYAVAGLLGDTVDTVLKVYGHLCPNYLEEAIRSPGPRKKEEGS